MTTDPNFPNYPLRKIDQKLWLAVKMRALEDGLSVRDVIEAALQTYAKDGLAAIGAKPPAAAAAAAKPRKKVM